MTDRKFYAGIGSRKTPPDMIPRIVSLASTMADRGYILRSGGAKGSDKAFERGCDEYEGKKEIFRAGDAQPWAFEEAEKHIPANRPAFSIWKPHTRSLIARGMMQILGRNGDEPVEFVICWTMARVRDGGGTGYPMRCAAAHCIPIFNIEEVRGFAMLHEWLKRVKV